MSKQFIVEMNDTEYCAIKATPEKYKTLAHKILDRGTLVKTGHWSRKIKVDAYDIAGVKTWGIKCQCDRCDFTTIVVEDFGYYKFCPNCGAKMQESED